jgi:hypothetical protein
MPSLAATTRQQPPRTASACGLNRSSKESPTDTRRDSNASHYAAGQLAGVPRNLTFVGGTASGRFRHSATMPGQRLLPLAANWCFRPSPYPRFQEVAAEDQPVPNHRDRLGEPRDGPLGARLAEGSVATLRRSCAGGASRHRPEMRGQSTSSPRRRARARPSRSARPTA